MSPRTEILLGICGLILTICSVVASVMQYKAGDLQAQVALAQLRPAFHISGKYQKVNSEKYTDFMLEISNEGGLAYDLKIDRITSLTIKTSTANAKYSPMECILEGYFVVSLPYDNVKGVVETISGGRNNEKWSSIYDVGQETNRDSETVGFPITILKISYTDTLNNNVTEYFEVSQVSTRRLTLERGRTMWNRLDALSDNPRRVTDLRDLDSPAAIKSFLAGKCNQRQ